MYLMDEPEITELQKKSDLLESQYNAIKKEFKEYIETTRKNEDLKKKEIQAEQAKKTLVFADSLCRMMDAAKNHPCDAIRKVHETYHLNVEGMYTQLLSSSGLKPINPAPGTPFDDATHMAVGIEYNSKHPENTIFSVIRRGYIRDSTLLRPAEVIISKTPRETAHKQNSSMISGLLSRLFPSRETLAALEHQIDALAHRESEHIVRLEGEIKELGIRCLDYEDEIKDLSEQLSHHSESIELLENEIERLGEDLRRSDTKIREIELKLEMAAVQRETGSEIRPLSSHQYSDDEWL